MAAALALPEAIPALGWMRIGLRLFLMIALLVACIPLYYIFRLTDRRNPVAPLFLGGVAWIAGVEIEVVGTEDVAASYNDMNSIRASVGEAPFNVIDLRPR